MKLALEISNLTKALKPKKDNIILYNGKCWYVTTLRDVLKPIYDTLAEYETNAARLQQNYIELANTTAKSLKEMAELIEKLYGDKKV